jgi:ATP-dependent Clp protease ATP-binding subunit ClpX
MGPGFRRGDNREVAVRGAGAEVAKLIGGPGVYVCDACVGLCNRILAGQPTPGFAGWEALSDEQLLASLAPSQAAVEVARAALQKQVDVLRRPGEDRRRLGITRQAAWERFS